MNIFDFRLIKRIGTPTSSCWLALVFVVVFSSAYLRTSPVGKGVRSVGWGVDRLLDMTEGENNPMFPKILVGGSSMSALGIKMDVLEKRLAASSCKISNSAGSLSECLLIMQRFENECKDVNMIFVDFDWVGNETDNTNEHQRRVRLLTSGSNQGNWMCALTSMRQPWATFYHWLKRGDDGPGPYEKVWYDPKYIRAAYKERQELREKWKRIQADGYDNMDWSFGLNIGTKEIPRETIGAFLDYCKTRSIFVVFFLPPKWRGSEWNLCEKYETYLTELDECSYCQVVRCPNFDYIDSALNLPHSLHFAPPYIAKRQLFFQYEQTETSFLKDEDCLIDRRHLSEYGATISTHWLLDQVLSSPKFAHYIQTVME